MNILYIANLVPFPLDGGGKIKTFTSIKALAKRNTIDLLCFYENENIVEAKAELSKYCRKVIFIPIKVTTAENRMHIAIEALKCLFTPKSLSITKYHSSKMIETIHCQMKQNSYDVAYFNYLHVYQYSEYIRNIKPEIKCVLDTQNCETLIFSRSSTNTKNIAKKWYFLLEAHKLGSFEKWAILDCDKVIYLSQEDKAILGELCKRNVDGPIIPIGVEEPKNIKEINKIHKEGPKILFLGTLTWAPNNEGIIWFLENVMPKLILKYKNIKLYIVGKNPSDRVKELSSNYEDNIVLTGYVDSVDPYYEESDMFIVPLFFGSGQRVKIIESFSRGMPVISTEIGAEGLKYETKNNILIANDADQFIKAIDRMIDYDIRLRISMNARKTFEEYYSIEAVGVQLNNVVESVVRL